MYNIYIYIYIYVYVCVCMYVYIYIHIYIYILNVSHPPRTRRRSTLRAPRARERERERHVYNVYNCIHVHNMYTMYTCLQRERETCIQLHAMMLWGLGCRGSRQRLRGWRNTVEIMFITRYFTYSPIHREVDWYHVRGWVVGVLGLRNTVGRLVWVVHKSSKGGFSERVYSSLIHK